MNEPAAPSAPSDRESPKGPLQASLAASGDWPVLILTGLSGAGKSTALRVMEDMGFFCVDGLPVEVLPKLLGVFESEKKAGRSRGAALGMDIRRLDFPKRWNQVEADLRRAGVEPHVIFLEASRQRLVRRYASTRRPHPLQTNDMGLEQAIEKERELLAPLRAAAELVLDTSHYSVHDLRRSLQEKWESIEGRITGMRAHLISFGFKYGPPGEADMVLDLRFLPNPYFVDDLRALTGKDQKVTSFVLDSPEGRVFLPKLMEFLDTLLPLYQAEGRRRLTLAFGCTGGMHRSVAVTEAVFAYLVKSGYVATIEHRHVELG